MTTTSPPLRVPSTPRPTIRPRRRRVAAGVVLVAAALAGCSSTGTTTSATTATTGAAGTTASSTATTGGTTAPTTAAPKKLKIMVTDDDGFDAASIDALVEGIRKEPDVEITVVAPLTNKSGTGGKTTTGTLTVTDAKTKSGYPVKAVDGFPADTVIWALGGGLSFRPDVVLSGNNAGQNVGPLVNISGTVGAAREAAKNGIPAIAVSQGLGDPVDTTDYVSGVNVMLEYFRAHRSEYGGTTSKDKPLKVTSFNIPTCNTGKLRGVKEVPTATDLAGRNLAVSDCTSTKTTFTDDIDAFINGYATQSTVELAAG